MYWESETCIRWQVLLNVYFYCFLECKRFWFAQFLFCWKTYYLVLPNRIFCSDVCGYTKVICMKSLFKVCFFFVRKMKIKKYQRFRRATLLANARQWLIKRPYLIPRPWRGPDVFRFHLRAPCSSCLSSFQVCRSKEITKRFHGYEITKRTLV